MSFMGMEFVLSYLTEGVWEDCAADICLFKPVPVLQNDDIIYSLG